MQLEYNLPTHIVYIQTGSKKLYYPAGRSDVITIKAGKRQRVLQEIPLLDRLIHD